MLPIVPTRRSPEAAKGWLLFIFFLPWVGLLLYVSLAGRACHAGGSSVACNTDLIEPVRQRMRALPQLAAPVVDSQYQPSVRLATDLGMLDNLGGNGVELLTDYTGRSSALLLISMRLVITLTCASISLAMTPRAHW